MALVNNTTVAAIEELPVTTFNDMAKSVQFLLEEVPYKPVKRMKVNGKRYGINYHIPLITQRQFVEITHFQQDLIPNLHNIMASIVQPVKLWVRRSNDPKKHSDYANDMLQAKFIDVYSAAVFFCKLYAASLRLTRDYLLMQIPEEQRAETWMRLSDLADTMDGFTTPKK